MKTTIHVFILLVGLLWAGAVQAQPVPAEDPVTFFHASQEKFGAAKGFSGTLRWEKSGGEAVAGSFWVQGERFKLVLPDRDWVGDGTYLWEIVHRDKRLKKRHYDPYNAPAVVHAFRLYRLDLLSEHVILAFTPDKGIAVEIEDGASVAQGQHVLYFDPSDLTLSGIVLHENQGDYLEKAEFGQVTAEAEGFEAANFTVDPAAWKKKGYSLLDMAKGENFTVLPEEKALKPE